MFKILIIEDDLDLALTIRENLKIRGADIQAITDGQKGLYFAMRHTLDAIILDYGLPSLDGLEIIKRLRRGGSEVPILILTGDNSQSALVEGLKNGADDYMAKPFKMYELDARLSRLMKRPPISKYAPIMMGDITLEYPNNSLERGGKKVKVSKRESKILGYMLLHRNNLVTRDSLQVNVWPDKPELKLNTIDCYMSSLRRKLSYVSKKEVITTQHGFGYKLVV